jgi:RNA polymerase sigma-70 factor (ECF subfamily)
MGAFGEIVIPSLAHVMGIEMAAEDAETRWIRESLAGSSDAFTALVRRHQERVFRLAQRFFHRPEEIEEVAQETFLRAWTKLGTYRGDAPFEHWLTRLCLHCAYDRLRRSRTEEEPWEEREVIAADGDPNARLEVERLLARLPAADRFVLILLEGEGWSVAEIAAHLGWTQVNVKVRAHRARKRLRRILEEG